LIELLKERAFDRPGHLVYTFLMDGNQREVNLTYGQLDRRSRAIAGRLQFLKPEPGRVLLLYPPGLEYIEAFFGCLYAAAVAVPAYPPRLNQSLTRLEGIVKDSQATLVLTTKEILSKAESLCAHAPSLEPLRWLATDSIEDELADQWREPRVTGDSLAFLQYTSGSTATPKGVMVSHGNLLHNQQMIQAAFEQTERSVIVGWLPLYHDMGLIGNVLQPLYLGAQSILMSPLTFLRHPFRWLQAISRYRATTSGGPNFAYDMCVRKITREQRELLDLSSWRVAFNGSEPICPETLERFVAMFEPCGFRREAFYPCYGMAEGTLLISAERRTHAPVIKTFQKRALENGRAEESPTHGDLQSLVSCGSALGVQKIVIVHHERLTECRPGEVGEIWVSGPSVAQGYWRRPEETAQTFRAYLADTSEGPFLRTADLGFMCDGELFVTGRLKDLIIIRGLNHYPQDIELTVERSHAALRADGGAAFSLVVDGEERLVVVQEVERRRQSEAPVILERIRQSVSEVHEVEVYAITLIKTGTIPKTSSGKIQRHACRTMFIEGSLEVIAEWSSAVTAELIVQSVVPKPDKLSAESIKVWLVQRLAVHLGVEPKDIDVNQPITHYGLDSLAAIELMHGIETGLGMTLPMSSLLQSPSISKLAAQAMLQLTTGGHADKPVRRAVQGSLDGCALSFGQRALYFLHQLAPESPAYNIASAMRLRGELDVETLRHSFEALIARHPSLRTTFTVALEEPIQHVHENMKGAFEVLDASAPSEASLQEHLVTEAYRPFNLAQGPLFRALLIRCSDSEHILLVAAHHIIADFWSLAILLHEVGVLYSAERAGIPAKLPQLTLDYVDYARWQTELLAGPEGERQWLYWQKKLTGELPVLNLPMDHQRPPVQTHHGAACALEISPELTHELKLLGREHSATLYMTLMAAFQILLHRYTGQRDILIGSPTSGRGWAELSGVVGYFVNPVVMRTNLSRSQTFEQFLHDVRRTTLDAFEHQDYPFALLVERIQPVRDPSRAPLVQVMFALQKAQMLNAEGVASLALGETGPSLRLGDLVLESIGLEQRVAQFDLTLMMAEVGDGLLGSLQYNTDLFDAPTIARMVGHFKTLLESIVADPGRCLIDLPLLTDAEQRKILSEWNQTGTPYALEHCVHELLEEQAARRPEACAISSRHGEMTYQELNSRANQLARHLRSLGIAPEVRVGTLLERSSDLIVGLLGVLKAGGAYVPLDPAYPAERLAFMLEDAQVRVLLTQQHLLDALPKHKAHIVCLDADWDRISEEDGENLIGNVRAANLAYIIYTSGSAGRPRGVQIQHGALLNLVNWHQRTYAVSPADRATQLGGVGFDASVWEVWPYLTGGASVHLPDEETRLSPGKLRDWLITQEITMSFLPTPLAEQILSLEWPPNIPLRTMLTGGDRLSFYPPSALPFEFVNHYGPTEYTVVTSFARLSASDDARTLPPIGRPISNTEIYVLDVNLYPVPVGVAGELHVGGAGLARGYLNQPDLTAERFIPNPFSRDPGARLYRTGDLARYLPNGDVEFLGRADSQVKIRGMRIELGEIEAVVCQHDGVREAVALVFGDQTDNKQIAVYFTASQNVALAPADLRSFMKEKLPDYMVPSKVVLMDELPLTANGKVDRRALPDPFVTGDSDEERVGQRTPTEEVLAGIWSQVLNIERVDVGENFFESGGHSLLATRVISRVREVFKVDLPLRKLFEEPTVASLANAIDEAVMAEKGLRLPPPSSVPRDGALPLSFAQQRTWFLNQLEPGNPFYNVPAAVRICGRLSASALAQSFNEVIRRHESLRTRFASDEGRAVQIILPKLELNLAVKSLQGLPAGKREEEALRIATEEAKRPFDLSHETLLRAGLLKLDEADHVLLVTMHHIVSDGWSMRVLIDELSATYQALMKGQNVTLPDLPIQYADFAAWQRACLQDEILEAHLSYWREQLGGSNFVLDLLTDRPRPAVQTFRGATIELKLPVPLGGALKALSHRQGVTLFMTLLAAFDVLLHRYTGQDDAIVGTPIAGRNQLQLENLIGMFVNTLVLRTNMSGDPTFAELLRRVRDVALGAYAHQDLPFEKLVEELQPQRDGSHTPLFQVMLVLHSDPTDELRLGELDLNLLKVDTGTSKFDLTLSFTETADGQLHCSLEYNTDLFDQITAAGMLEHLQTLLEGILQNPERRISELPLMTDDERRQVLVKWNDTHAEYPQECLYALFEQQAERGPDLTALVFDGQRLSYRELNERANRLAHYLRREGVGAETLVGVLMKRSVEMVVSLLGVLKAGGAYLPLDPAYPRERLRFMLEDAAVTVLLTQRELVEALPESAARVVCVDTQWPEIAGESAENPENVVTPENLAYVIYTSGSTGQPKGVAIAHRSAVVLLQWAQEVFSAESLRGVLASTSICFDLSVFELFVPLSCGGKIILAENALHLPAIAASEEVTLINTVPSAINELRKVGGIPASVRTVNLAGEPLPNRLVQEIYEQETVEQVFNLYGPTEDTTYSTFVLTPRDSPRPVTIGRPIACTQVYVLDQRMQPVPVGVAGEIFLGGAGLARGYLRRPAITAERFIPNQFSTQAGARLYRTGDLARYLPNGELEFIGRADHQVKLRGFRIELGEVEAVLRSHVDVAEVVAVVREDTPGEQRLVAYLTNKAEANTASAAELRRYLKEKLPDYMVPNSFLILQTLPLTPNGKIDRRALPAPDQTMLPANGNVVAPRTAVEEKLVAIWCELLGVSSVSIIDNFFDMGGHSLLLTQLASRIRSTFGIELPLRRLFELTTIADLSTSIEKAGEGNGASPATVIEPRRRDAYRMKVSAQGTLVVLDDLKEKSAPGHFDG